MTQPVFGFLLFLFLIVPPVSNFMESIMVVHMHMQMPMFVISGLFMARFFQQRFPRFFEKWNDNGVPGMILFVIIIVYWTIPRTMDEALTTVPWIEGFKFISLPFLAGVPLRDSWKKLRSFGKRTILISFTFLFFGMGLLYIYSPEQLCNNYLFIEQITLGWAFLTMAICIAIYLIYEAVVDKEAYA